MSKVFIRSKGNPNSVEVELEDISGSRLKFTLGNETQEINIQIKENEGVLNHSGRLAPFYYLSHNEEIELWIGGRIYHFETSLGTPPKPPETLSRNGSGEINSPMPGRILKITVEVGEIVKENHTLLTMESMKMEMTLTAPRSGRVKEINCRPGDLVEMGQRLIVVEA